jgi:AraC-like DNA-binding protein
MSRVPPSRSTKPPARHNEFSGTNRRMRRAKIKHHGLFTRNTVWRNWENLPLLEEGILLRIERLAKRRGKSKTWVTKRFNRDVKRYRNYRSEQAARLKEIFEQMQQGMLDQEHNHEHDRTDEPDNRTDTDT